MPEPPEPSSSSGGRVRHVGEAGANPNPSSTRREQSLRRDMRQHPDSFQHGLFHITYREDKHGKSYTAHCPFHSFGTGRPCTRDTRINQPSPDVVKLRLMHWCNLASKHTISRRLDPSEIELARKAYPSYQLAVCLFLHVDGFCKDWKHIAYLIA